MPNSIPSGESRSFEIIWDYGLFNTARNSAADLNFRAGSDEFRLLVKYYGVVFAAEPFGSKSDFELEGGIFHPYSNIDNPTINLTLTLKFMGKEELTPL